MITTSEKKNEKCSFKVVIQSLNNCNSLFTKIFLIAPAVQENSMISRFYILSRNTYNLFVLKSLFILTRQPKTCKQQDFLKFLYSF